MDKLYDAAKTYDGKYFRVVEGGVPTGANGRYCIVGERKGKEITKYSEITGSRRR
jgi:hydrogenase small subunit